MTAQDAVPADVVAARPWLWGLCYRLLGDAADADEVVQDTLWRAVSRPPVDQTRPWRPWLCTVATRLARDRLRARRRKGWAGPWLPTPVPDELLADGAPGPDQQAAWRDAASFAWLLAAERLTPNQRAVLLLRDVAGLSAAETAEALGMADGTVRVTLLRARRAAAGGAEGRTLSAAERAAAEAALVGFLGAIAADDVAEARRWLADDVEVRSDGGGRYRAARVPFSGADKAVAVWRWLRDHAGPPDRWAFAWRNGCVSVRFEADQPPPGYPTHTVLLLEVRGGVVTQLWSVLGEKAAWGAS